MAATPRRKRGTGNPNGRPQGAATKKSSEVAAKLATDGNLTPLEAMVLVMREAHAEGDRQLMLSAAVSAAPYMHPRLNAVTVKGTGEDGALVVQVIRYAGGDDAND